MRGVAQVRHAALTAATGSMQHTYGHSSSTGVGAEGAWDSTGDRAQGGFASWLVSAWGGAAILGWQLT